MRSIVFASGKGGTGKTTTIVNIGTSLAQFGLKTVIIDADITMANVSLVLGMEDTPYTLHDVLSGEATPDQVIYEGPAGLHVIPGGLSLEKIKKADPQKLQRLKDVVARISQNYDYVLIDAPAGLEISSLTALLIGKELIIVTNPEISAITDSLKTKLVAEKLGTRPLGTILNRVSNERTELSKEEVEAILELPLLGLVPDDPEVKRSSAFGMPLVIRNPTSPAAVAYKQIAAKIAGVEYEPPSPSNPFKKILRSVFGK